MRDGAQKREFTAFDLMLGPQQQARPDVQRFARFLRGDLEKDMQVASLLNLAHAEPETPSALSGLEGRLLEHAELKRKVEAERLDLSEWWGPPKLRTLSFTLEGGMRLVSAPYDGSWIERQGFSSPSEGWFSVGLQRGQVGFFDAIENMPGGFDAAGISLQFSSPVEAYVYLDPLVQYRYMWVKFSSGFSSSSGGISLCVYRGGDPQPIVYRRSILWEASSSQTEHKWGEGLLSDAHAVSAVFAMNMTPVGIDVWPNVGYELWVWAWMYHQPAVFGWGNITAVMPLVNVTASAGPVPVVK